MEGRRVGKGSGGETCREGKWRGDVWGSGGETSREGKWRGDVWEVEGRHVGKWRGDV